MSAESPGAAPADGTEAPSRRRLKPSHVTMIIAFVLALVVTAGSGIIAAIAGASVAVTSTRKKPRHAGAGASTET